MNKIKKKLSSNSGESFGEAMVGALIIMLAVLMLAAFISSAYNIMESSDKKMKSYYEVVNTIESGNWTGNDANLTIQSTSSSGLFFPGKTIPISKYADSNFGDLMIYKKK